MPSDNKEQKPIDKKDIKSGNFPNNSSDKQRPNPPKLDKVNFGLDKSKKKEP